MKNWEQKSLGDILTFQRGFDITKNDQTEGTVPIVSSSGITSYHNKFKVNGPGVVTGRKGTLGKVHFIREDFWPHDTTLWIKDFKGNDKKFLYYFLNLMQLQNYDVGASNPTLNRNHIHKIKLFCPPFPTQKKIAAILSAYDDLIENNTRRIALLELMAEELYKEWFVRMRFPGHEQTRFVKGIPEGWMVLPLNKLTKVITKGTTPTSLGKSFVDEGINFIKIESIDFNGGFIQNKFAKIDISTHELLKRSQLIENDILFSIAGAIGRSAIVSKDILPANTNQALAIIRPNSPHLVFWLTKVISSESFINHCLERVVQTAQANVSLSVISETKIALPVNDLIIKFNEKAIVIFDKVKCLTKANQLLRQTRDRLLTRLISGKLSVEDLDIAFPPSMMEDEIVQAPLAQKTLESSS